MRCRDASALFDWHWRVGGIIECLHEHASCAYVRVYCALKYFTCSSQTQFNGAIVLFFALLATLLSCAKLHSLQLLLLRCALTTDFLIAVFVVISAAANCQQLSDFDFLNCALCMPGATYHCYTSYGRA